MSEAFEIRHLTENDFESITVLNHQLGYEIESELVHRQITEILKESSHIAFVVLKEEKVVGYIHSCTSIKLTTEPFIEICSLVIDKNERQKGIGELLLRKIESIANRQVKKIRVRCNVKREGAHLFYEKSGFVLNKEQKVFDKKMNELF